jgi:hypothetical protein
MDKQKAYNITSVCREDMESIGFDTETLTDEDMQKIAETLGESYVTSGFWQDLESILIESYKLKQHDM